MRACYRSAALMDICKCLSLPDEHRLAARPAGTLVTRALDAAEGSVHVILVMREVSLMGKVEF